MFIEKLKMSWEPGWEQKHSNNSNIDVLQAIAEVDVLIEKADTKIKVLEIVNKLIKIVSVDVNNYYALWTLGRYSQLVAIGYTRDRKEKEKYCLLSIQACERAMYTNSEFKKQIDDGKEIWEAVNVLTLNEMEGMYYWYSSVGTYWKECHNSLGKLLNIKWTFRTKKILERMMVVEPEWGGGHPYFAFGVYFSVAPGFGNKKKAAEYFQKAVEVGPKWLYIRWGRAKFLYTAKKDRERFREDLEFVVSEDPHKADSPYPWNVYFQRSAQEMLEKL